MTEGTIDCAPRAHAAAADSGNVGTYGTHLGQYVLVLGGVLDVRC